MLPSKYNKASVNTGSTLLNFYSDTERFLDYRQVVDNFGEETYNLAPRFHMCDIDVSRVYNGCIMALDTEREKAIDLGVSYPFASLSAGECVVSSQYQE